MIKNLFTAASLFLMFMLPEMGLSKDGYPRSPGIDILHYCFRINLNDSTNRIDCKADISAGITMEAKSIALDLTGVSGLGKGMRVDRVMWEEKPLTWNHENNRLKIEIPDTPRTSAVFICTVYYSGIPADGLIISKNKFGERTFFSDNWPDRARNWLPCVDHPSDKATVEFIITAPENYEVVSNGYIVSEYTVTSDAMGRQKVTHWKENVPIPTKVMVFGAADFAWTTAGFSHGTPVQSYVYAQNREAGFTDYNPAVDIMTYYQDLIGPYSYEKLANVQSKTMFGGMENSGCIFYYENSVTGKNKLHSLLAHEIAHQWFGDAVTENDWHHVWLSEGFATYLEACYADSLIPGRQLDASMAEMRKSVVEYYKRTHKPVIDTTITNNMELLSTNSYQKGAWVLHMLRQEVGETLFWNGIRTFYATYRDKNAMTADFQNVMEQVSGRDLNAFFRQWLEIPGQPDIQWSWTWNKKRGEVEIIIEQTQSHFNFAFSLPVQVCGKPSAADPAVPGYSVEYQVPVSEKTTKIVLPADFPVSEIRLDPHSHLLFQEVLLKK